MRKRRTHGENEASGPQLPITPMLDMAFQILAFFVFTYHPSGLEGQMELNLPALGEAKAKDPSEVDPKAQSEDALELPSEVTIIVNTQPQGATMGDISVMSVQQREGNRTIGSLEQLQDHLKQIHGTLQNKNDIKIQADSRLKWARVVEVMDVCQNVGFKGIGFGPPPDIGAP